MSERNLNGAQVGELNFEKFSDWIKEREAKEDWVQFIHNNKLNRAEIVRELGFSDTSTLRRNPRIKDALEKCEEKLRKNNILGADTQSNAEKTAEKREAVSSSFDKNRIKKLEETVQALKAENKSLREKLEKENLLSEHIAETGRLLRL
jgi:predicted RNase H-like nuclease (RuvC/YqgF family)